MGKVSRALTKAETGTKSDFPSPALDIPERSDSAAEIRSATVAPVFPQTEGNMKSWDERLLIAIDNFSGAAESFRKLRTMILHPEEGKPPRTVLVLSAEPQEGKSFVCANLGVSFAHDVGRQALMIDSDLRRPTLHNLFGLNSSRGLVDYLVNEAENISDFILATGSPNLSLIPAGAPPANPSELVSSAKMSAMIEELADRYSDHLVLVDGPPFHAAAEAMVLAQIVDKVVLVVRWGKCGREAVKKMVEQVGREKITGIVFNAFEMNILDRKSLAGGYNSYYPSAYY